MKEDYLPNGQKKVFKENDHAKLDDYKEFRRSFGGGAYCMDIDQFEYRIENGIVSVKAFFEMTERTYPGEMEDNFLGPVWRRIANGSRGKVLRKVAEIMKCEAYIVIFRKDLSEFVVRSLIDPKPWKFMTQEEYKKWIKEEFQSNPSIERIYKLVETEDF